MVHGAWCAYDRSIARTYRLCPRLLVHLCRSHDHGHRQLDLPSGRRSQRQRDCRYPKRAGNEYIQRWWQFRIWYWSTAGSIPHHNIWHERYRGLRPYFRPHLFPAVSGCSIDTPGSRGQSKSQSAWKDCQRPCRPAKTK